MIKKLTIYNVLSEESKYIGKNILEFLDINYNIQETSKLMTIFRPLKVSVLNGTPKNAAIEFLEAIGYAKGIRKTKTGEKLTTYYLKKHEERKDQVSSKFILNNSKTPTLCFLLETELG
ncbi:hypothetical protein GF374_00900 [Candidatus Woesearchaeota archaeon]|nr:hypothetical protein [Candidatus Woesearchaeota archaeon]